MKKKILISYKNKKISIEAIRCNIFKKFSGLMFSLREKSQILLFEFKISQPIAIHSFFVFYSFLAIWLDSENNITDMKIVKPFTSCAFAKKSSNYLLEIPINKKNEKILKFFGVSVAEKQNI